MTYRVQTTSRREVRRGTAGPVVVELDSQVASATFRVIDPDGAVALSTTSATVVDIGEPARSRLSCSVPTSLTLAEGYELEITAAGVVEWVPFDVVLRPLGRGPSLDDVLQVRTQAADAIEAQARRLGVMSEQYVEQVLADRARSQLQTMLRKQLPTDDRVRWARPYAVLDADKLHRIEILLVVAYLYEASMSGAEEGDQASRLHTHYAAAAAAEMASLGRLRIDLDGDGVADVRQSPTGATIPLERVQG